MAATVTIQRQCQGWGPVAQLLAEAMSLADGYEADLFSVAFASPS